MNLKIVVEEAPMRKRVCCNCARNIRIKDEKGMVTENRCEIDGHYIGYVECFEGWCKRWKKDRTFEEEKP